MSSCSRWARAGSSSTRFYRSRYSMSASASRRPSMALVRLLECFRLSEAAVDVGGGHVRCVVSDVDSARQGLFPKSPLWRIRCHRPPPSSPLSKLQCFIVRYSPTFTLLLVCPPSAPSPRTAAPYAPTAYFYSPAPPIYCPDTPCPMIPSLRSEIHSSRLRIWGSQKIRPMTLLHWCPIRVSGIALRTVTSGGYGTCSRSLKLIGR